ncbi:MAG: T9SS type A sorting domain-containing protein [Flavobacteriaceae bacterium]|nr:T9SS type A sorting domain-containing protein [Flavobacteriaceae bacterium]
MKTIYSFTVLMLLFVSNLVIGQTRDTLVTFQGKQLHFDYDVRWSPSEFENRLNEFKANQALTSFKASPSISAILNDIPVSNDPCRNGGFEDGYNDWTGLSLTHSLTTIPIENGLVTSPGIAPLPFTGTGFGQNYTSLETTGLDPVISVASPPFPLQRTAPGTTGTQSLRLGNDQPGFGAEGVAKRFVVTPANAEYYFQYAIVMDRSHSNPDGSINGTEVFFIAEATDMSGATIDKVVDVGNPGNPFINAVNGGTTYFRDWRCAYLDLSSHIGQEVVIMFINSDCSAGGHKGYTYVDDVCEECENVNEGDINLNLQDGDCLYFPYTVNGDFLVPAGASNVNITLEIYQSNALVNTITSPTIAAPNYSFTLAPTDFPDQTPGSCYDLVAVLTFDLIDLNGNLVTVTQKSSKEVLGVQDGERPGINNDVCFCDDSQNGDEGSYCCPDENLVTNGNFEFGNTGFSSSYIQTASTYPGEYDVTNSAANFGATVTDHSFCDDPITYAVNDLFMVVNGRTQQTSTAIIWEQTLTGLEQGERYKFCANFKNMPQCTFDILPVVFMNAGTTSSGAQTINTNPADPCDWQNVEITFTATGTSQNVRILLDEGGNGDGNDLAIDDIYVGKLADPDLQITVQHDGTSNTITGSLNTISTADDTLHGSDCEYYWFVAETGFPLSIDFSTFAFGNGGGSMLPPFASVPGPAWGLTTTFPGYTFVDNQLYVVGMYTPECGCYDEGFTYQLTFNTLHEQDMEKTMREAIIDAILNGLDGGALSNDTVAELPQEKMALYPNPVDDVFTIQLLEDTITEIQVLDISGKSVIIEKRAGGNREESIHVASLPTGVYFVNVRSALGNSFTSKLVKR